MSTAYIIQLIIHMLHGAKTASSDALQVLDLTHLLLHPLCESAVRTGFYKVLTSLLGNVIVRKWEICKRNSTRACHYFISYKVSFLHSMLMILMLISQQRIAHWDPSNPVDSSCIGPTWMAGDRQWWNKKKVFIWKEQLTICWVHQESRFVNVNAPLASPILYPVPVFALVVTLINSKGNWCSA